MTQFPPCKRCSSVYTYNEGALLICPECAYEWIEETQTKDTEEFILVKDAYGTCLSDGDTVTLIKDLKVKGASSPLKIGTKVRNIRLVEGDHNIDCRIEGYGEMKLKSEFVKKV